MMLSTFHALSHYSQQLYKVDNINYYNPQLTQKETGRLSNLLSNIANEWLI